MGKSCSMKRNQNRVEEEGSVKKSFSSYGESDKVVGISPVINDKIDRNASDSLHPDMEICNSSEQRRDRRRRRFFSILNKRLSKHCSTTRKAKKLQFS